MKSLATWVLALAVIAGGAAFAFNTIQKQQREEAYKLGLADLKQRFRAANVGLSFLDAEAYRQEIGIHLNQYFTELRRLTELYPEFYNVERERKQGAEQLAKGILSDTQVTAREERIALTLDVMKKMGAGQYRPLYTAADKSFRFDIYDTHVETIEGEPRLKLSYIHWGAFGPVSYKSIVGTLRAQQVKGKPIQIPQIVGEGQPPSLQVPPERWVAEFVPGAEIGYYDLPLFPRETEGLQLTFEMGLRTVGGSEQTATITFPEMPIPETWKLKEGQVWEAQERIASEDELRAAGVPASK